MCGKLFDVFKQYNFRLMVFYDSCHFKKHCATGVFETFHLAHYAERLAGKACQEQIVFGDVGGSNFCYIACWAFSEVSLVGVCRSRVPFR